MPSIFIDDELRPKTPPEKWERFASLPQSNTQDAHGEQGRSWRRDVWPQLGPHTGQVAAALMRRNVQTPWTAFNTVQRMPSHRLSRLCVAVIHGTAALRCKHQHNAHT
jgi:hypothetical protein